MYNLSISEQLNRTFKKLARKNRAQMGIINKKIPQILENPYHFKPLRGDMFGERRVHIDSHFVLTFEIDETNKTVRLLDFDHHDVIYQDT